MTDVVAVDGFRDFQRDLAKFAPEIKKELRKELRGVAEPVKATAEQLAGSEIRNIGSSWSQMRIGTTNKGVYVAPKSRRNKDGSPRPNLANLLLSKSMEPAVDRNAGLVEERLAVAVEHVAKSNGWH